MVSFGWFSVIVDYSYHNKTHWGPGPNVSIATGITTYLIAG